MNAFPCALSDDDFKFFDDDDGDVTLECLLEELHKNEKTKDVVGDIVRHEKWQAIRLWRDGKPGGWAVVLKANADTFIAKYTGTVNRFTGPEDNTLFEGGETIVLDEYHEVYGWSLFLESESWWEATAENATKQMEAMKSKYGLD